IYELGEELKNPGLPAETAEQYRREIDELTALNRLINRQMREIEVELSRIDNLLSGAELTPSQVTAYKAAIAAIENGIAEMEDEIAKMEAVFPTYGSELPAECRWEKYGWLGLSPHDIRNCPSKHDDLQMYLEELIYNDESKFKRQYADWPVILKRYTYLRAILAAEGYDFFKIRLLLTSQ
ncbi:hypothetical protein LJC45_05755, partial [Alistipes sp. OttesenSCG-928-B03]|nr:hypothetical protein [Alistipes sp. OttesenSCG-928-B03]